MKQLISDNLKASLVEQFGAEKYNSHVYLYIASYLNGKGLNNLANIFEKQHEEEQNHSLMIYNLLTDLGVSFDFPEVNGCNMPFETIIDIANLFFDREVLTTTSLNEIKMQAESESGTASVVAERMREMLLLQQNEHEESTTFLDQAMLTGGDWKFVMLWDVSLKD